VNQRQDLTRPTGGRRDWTRGSSGLGSWLDLTVEMWRLPLRMLGLGMQMMTGAGQGLQAFVPGGTGDCGCGGNRSAGLAPASGWTSGFGGTTGSGYGGATDPGYGGPGSGYGGPGSGSGETSAYGGISTGPGGPSAYGGIAAGPGGTAAYGEISASGGATGSAPPPPIPSTGTGSAASPASAVPNLAETKKREEKDMACDTDLRGTDLKIIEYTIVSVDPNIEDDDLRILQPMRTVATTQDMTENGFTAWVIALFFQRPEDRRRAEVRLGTQDESWKQFIRVCYCVQCRMPIPKTDCCQEQANALRDINRTLRRIGRDYRPEGAEGGAGGQVGQGGGAGGALTGPTGGGGRPGGRRGAQGGTPEGGEGT
jgi:hypothetical protein